MSDLPAVWTPKEFEGTDLLPTGQFTGQVQEADLTGRENIELRDLIFPSLRCLSGQSQPVTERMEGAAPGRFYLSSAGKFYDPPLRVLLVAHTRSRALFPNIQDPRHRGLETCISRNGITGNVYGDCGECKHKDWGATKDDKPPCSEAHNFTAFTPDGPAVVRLWKTSYKNAKEFLTRWQTSPYPLWKFPAVVTVRSESKDLPGGKKQPYFVLGIRWDERETVPQAAQEMARVVHQQIKAAHEAGRFGFDSEESAE